ncbi:MAG TPA: hypothetical protein DHV48_03755 [Prolixibacteraceae bacterium]|nr:hypothetical protein [Prolixibacteraceae bacterium]
MKTSEAYSIPGIKTIEDMVAEAFEVTVSEIMAPDKKGPGKEARFFLMWYMKKNTTLSLKLIGKKFSDRDHSTVVYACKQVEIWKETDKIYRAKCEKALEILEKIKVTK